MTTRQPAVVEWAAAALNGGAVVPRLLRLTGVEGRPRLNALTHPRLGGLYRIDSAVVSGNDPKEKRPAVVIRLPVPGLDSVIVLTR
ncbi:MAG TPA: hypothetical protein VFJ21_13295, partial [Mycobacteriales bacterium]|nr:hypothetical protein [Mycobacteriales bacterium]